MTFSLAQNVPNPFNPSTTIHYELPTPSRVRLLVYDITGRLVTTLVDEFLNAGAYDINWHAAQYSSGLYFYTLETDSYKHRRKMMLLK